MRRFAFLASAFFPLLMRLCVGQSGAVIPQGGAGHAAKASCVILKRMGPADQVTSHLYSFGIRGKQFQYVEGKLPDGFPFHGRLTDHDVRNLQSRGAEVVVVNPNFTAEDLRQARSDCRGETGTTPNQSEAKEAPLPEPTSVDVTATGRTTLTPQAVSAKASVPAIASTGKLFLASTPDGADIEVDGNFVGNTPSDLQVSDGEHMVSMKKAGFKEWQRKLKVSAGSSVHLNAELEKAATP